VQAYLSTLKAEALRSVALGNQTWMNRLRDQNNKVLKIEKKYQDPYGLSTFVNGCNGKLKRHVVKKFEPYSDEKVFSLKITKFVGPDCLKYVYFLVQIKIFSNLTAMKDQPFNPGHLNLT